MPKEARLILTLFSESKFQKTRLNSAKENLETIDEKPPGFRISFEERYDELKEIAHNVEPEIEERDFPKPRISSKRHEELERKIQDRVHNKAPLENADDDVEKIEKILDTLLGQYHQLALKNEDSKKLEQIRSRIHDSKRKIELLKNNKKSY